MAEVAGRGPLEGSSNPLQGTLLPSRIFSVLSSSMRNLTPDSVSG